MSDAAAEPAAGRDAALDGLRGLATLWVFVYHYGGGLHSHNPLLRAAGYFTQAGWVGVELFFALSGFLITESLFRVPGQSHGWRNYLLRRALRILPLYYLAVLAACAGALLLSVPWAEMLPAVPYLLLLQDLPSLTPLALRFAAPLPLHHLWSLAVEVQFYLLWPVVVLHFAPGKRFGSLVTAAFGLFAFLALVRAAIFLPAPFAARPVELWAGFLPVRAGALVLGGALSAGLRAHRWPRWRAWAWPALVLAAVAMVGVGVTCAGLLLERPAQMVATLTAVEIGSAACVFLVLEPTCLRRLCEIAPLRWIGRISYGFYIFHLLLKVPFDRLATLLTHSDTGNAFQAARFVVALPATLLVSWMSYRFFEQPILAAKRRFPLPEPLDGVRSEL